MEIINKIGNITKIFAKTIEPEAYKPIHEIKESI